MVTTTKVLDPNITKHLGQVPRTRPPVSASRSAVQHAGHFTRRRLYWIAYDPMHFHPPRSCGYTKSWVESHAWGLSLHNHIHTHFHFHFHFHELIDDVISAVLSYLMVIVDGSIKCAEKICRPLIHSGLTPFGTQRPDPYR